MKKLISTIALCVVVFALCAQTVPIPGNYSTIIGGGTNKAVAVSTNAYFEINCESATDLAVAINFSYLNAVGAGDVNRLDLELFRGIGGGIFESNVWQTLGFSAAATTTTPRCTVTNWSVAGIPALRCRWLNVSTNAHATNITVLVRPKNERVLSK